MFVLFILKVFPYTTFPQYFLENIWNAYITISFPVF